MLNLSLRSVVFATVLAGCFAAPAMGVQIRPLSYDMPNGHGHTTGGYYNYWDKSYTGAGNTTDNAPLTGGLGDLTDGVIETRNWNLVENHEGTGPYVGWININPTIVFHFDAGQVIDEVIIHTDDSRGQGGVSPPTDVVINGVSYRVKRPDRLASAPFAIDVSELELSGDVTIQLMRRTPWVFISEVQFAGPGNSGARSSISIDVPEPGTLVLLTVGLVGLVGVRRRRA